MIRIIRAQIAFETRLAQSKNLFDFLESEAVSFGASGTDTLGWGSSGGRDEKEKLAGKISPGYPAS